MLNCVHSWAVNINEISPFLDFSPLERESEWKTRKLNREDKLVSTLFPQRLCEARYIRIRSL
jgi:hypothetical protein